MACKLINKVVFNRKFISTTHIKIAAYKRRFLQ